MATANQQVVYAVATPPHGAVQYEYYTHQVPQTTAYATSVPVQYGGGAPPPPPGATAMEQSADGAARRSPEEATSALAGPNKKPRPDSAGGSGETYPQRPGEKMCAYYMTTRLCSFGGTCRYDHPSWVPVGGIPNWKEVTTVGTPLDAALLPQRPTEPDCAYFMKTGECRYGSKCRFNHPKEKLESSTTDEQFTGANHVPVKPATAFNSRGLPLRPGEGNCVFYGKTGSCKYGTACRYNHPEIQLAGGRTGATLQPQQAVYVQPQQQSNVQYQMVQATQDYAYPTSTFQSPLTATQAYATAAAAYPSTGTNLAAYPVTTTYTTAAPAYATQPAAAYPNQQVMQTVEYVSYPAGTTMQVYPAGTTTQAYPPGTPTQAYPQGTTAQSFPPGTPTQAYSQAQAYPPGTPTQAYPQGTMVQQYPQGTTGQVFSQAQSYPPGTTTAQAQQQTYPPGTTTITYPPGTPSQNQGATAQTYPPGTVTQTYPPGTNAQAVEYAYPGGQQPQAQQEYVYATQQASQNGGTEYVYSTEQPAQQASSDQYMTAYATDASGQPTTTEYAYTTGQTPQEYAYAAAQAYHQNVAPVYVTPMGLPHPQRPGEPDCTFYIKTGECSFGATCKFHHPPDRIPTGVPKPVKTNQTPVKLSLAGLPRRETEAPCAYYMKTGACKFGPTCKYDHPPPQEIIATAVAAARGEIPGSYDVNMQANVAADSQETTPLPPGTDVPAVTAAAAM